MSVLKTRRRGDGTVPGDDTPDDLRVKDLHSYVVGFDAGTKVKATSDRRHGTRLIRVSP